MTTTRETYLGAQNVGLPEEAPSRAPILITEHDVALSTAATLRQPMTTHWWINAASIAVSALQRLVTTSAADTRPRRSHCPKRYTYIDNARMGREMERL
ncbi:hypothetical protein [Mycobacterium sp. URHB0044]|jgi:hypothetical protein|uniref:hypothetical protein n=1 Tax=Mycobacterium sp. URHB0044 TaxID=1380386 RepID=UPI00048EB86B|nr:hypothetical protein [Mycobacterium sp. URHB0044]